MLTKTNLSLYIVWKKEMKEVTFIDNQQASTIFFQARANCLPLNERKRYKKEDTRCMMCNAENEDLAHFILNCPAYEEERKESMHLQKPDAKDILGMFLFEEEDIEEEKEVLLKLWKIRRLPYLHPPNTQSCPLVRILATQTNHNNATHRSK